MSIETTIIKSGAVLGARRRFALNRLATPRVALGVGIFELALGIGSTALAVVGGSAGSNLAGAPVVVSCAVVGVIVAYNRPRNAMGWLVLGMAASLLLSGLGAQWSVFDYRRHHGELPFGPLAVMIEPSWAPAILLVSLCVLLYPDGRLPSRRWRWPARWVAVIASAWMLGAYAIALDVLARGAVHINATGDLAQIDTPSGAWAWWAVAQDAFFVTMVAVLVAWGVSQATGYRKLQGERRAQQKWLLAGASGVGASLLATIPLLYAEPTTTAKVLSDIALAAWGMFPVAMGVGIMKYRLYEIDRIVSRTLAYAILTALLAGVFVSVVLLTTRVLPFSSGVGVAASTLAAAVLFNLLRQRVQRAVDRRFNRARYDAEATVSAFAHRLRDTVELDAVQADLLDTVERAVEPAHVTLWLAPAHHSTKLQTPG